MKKYRTPLLQVVLFQGEHLLASSPSGKLPDGHTSPSVGESREEYFMPDESESTTW